MREGVTPEPRRARVVLVQQERAPSPQGVKEDPVPPSTFSSGVTRPWKRHRGNTGEIQRHGAVHRLCIGCARGKRRAEMLLTEVLKES